MLNLIFDFDGVIGNTWTAVVNSLVKSGREADIVSAERNATNYALNGSHHTRNHTMTEEEMKAEYEWISRFGQSVHDHGFDLFDDFVTVIENFSNARKAIVSSGSQTYILPALAKTRINPTHILAFENHHSKEEKVELICKDWKVSTNEIYYFTDTLADFYELSKLIAKDKLFGVSWGYCSREQLLEQFDEGQILNTPDDIHRVL